VDIANAQVLTKSEAHEQVLANGVSTQYHGRGYFVLCVKKGDKYVLRYKNVDHEIDVEKYNDSFEFNDIKVKNHILMKLQNSVLEEGESIDLTLVKENSDEKVDLMVTVTQKKNLLHSQKVTLSNKETSISIPGSKFRLPNGGVLSVSLFEAKDVPDEKDESERSGYRPPTFKYQTIANSLVFILPSNTLDIKLKTDKESYSPGEKVNYEIIISDKKTGTRIKEDVFVSLGVTDLSPFLEIENKRQPPNLVSQVYLEKEVLPTKEYEFLNANEFLDFMYLQENGDSEGNKMKIELLLGTQKWRLFWFDPTFADQHFPDTYSLRNLRVQNNPQFFAMNEMAAGRMGGIMRKGAMPMEDMMLEAMPVATAVPPMAPPVPGPIKEVEEIDEEDEGIDENKGESTESPKDKDDDALVAERANLTQLFTNFILIKKGKYEGSFTLNEVITKFRFEVNAVSKSGVYGMLLSYFNSNKDFYIESNVPFFFTSKDEIKVPVVIHNSKGKDLTVELDLETNLEHNELEYKFSEKKVTVSQHSTKQVNIIMNAKRQTDGEFQVKISAKCGDSCSDSILKTSKIIGRGFPVVTTQSGFIGSASKSEFKDTTTLEIPLGNTFEEGTLELKAKIYTSQLSQIHEALEKLIRDPHG
jgi:hypothetical protein